MGLSSYKMKEKDDSGISPNPHAWIVSYIIHPEPSDAPLTIVCTLYRCQPILSLHSTNRYIRLYYTIEAFETGIVCISTSTLVSLYLLVAKQLIHVADNIQFSLLVHTNKRHVLHLDWITWLIPLVFRSSLQSRPQSWWSVCHR